MTKELVTKKQVKDALQSIEQELSQEYLDSVKRKAKELMKEIRMTEIVLEKKKKQLDEIMSGKKIYSEESLLFGE